MNEENVLNSIKNNSFESRWLDIVSVDHDYDGDFLTKLVCRKLKLMIEYNTNLINKFEHTSDDYKKLIKTINQLQSCYDLGLKILTFNYGQEADKLFDEKGNSTWLVETSNEVDYLQWNELSNKAELDRKNDIKNFYNKIGKNIDGWWI